MHSFVCVRRHPFEPYKVYLAEALMKTEKGVTVTTMAAIIYGAGCGDRGRNKLYEKMREIGWLKSGGKEHNLPYQNYLYN